MYGDPGNAHPGQAPATPVPKFPVQSQTEEAPFLDIYGALFHGFNPSVTTKDCLAGILKYLLKSY